MKQRIITAAVGIAVGILVLILNNTVIYPLFAAAIAIGAIHEIFFVCGVGSDKFPVHYGMCMAFAAAMPIMAYYEIDYIWRIFVAALIVFLLFAGYVADNKKLSFDKLSVMVTITCLVTMSVTCLVSLRNMSSVHGICYVVMALMGAWIPDSGAYFVGTALGKHKLCPSISPKKTVEGAIGGVAVTGIVFAVYGFVYQQIMHANGVDFSVNYLAIVLIFMIGSVISIFGDLTASLLKREYGIKDYGSLFPGHGGVVDRFDSVFFVLPYVMLTLRAISIFY